MKSLAVTVLATTLLAQAALAQQVATEYKTTPLSDTVTAIQARGGNVAVSAGEDGVFIIDDQYKPSIDELLAVVKGVSDQPVRFVINTHYHGDHVGGNEKVGEAGGVIIAHDNIRKRLEAKSDDAGGEGGLPIVTFSESVTFHVNGHEAYVFHVHAAHTDGDGVIHFRDDNVIHAGDIMFNFLFPYIDLDNGGTVDGFIAAQQKIVAMADDETVIIPGHGDIGSKADLEQNLAVLIDSRKRVKALVDAGKSEEEILAENPLADYHDQYNWSFITTERMTKTLYRDLTTD